jgi:suppressor of cytokine signaling 5
LLRDSAHKEHLFSVSFRRYNKTLHARIEQWDHKYSFDHESPVAYFSITIEGLLSHYSIGEYCMFFEPMLVKPLIRTQPQPLMSLCRGAIGNCTRYEDIEKLPIPSSLKTYLKEYNYCIKPKSKKDDDGKRKRNSTLCIF